MQSTNLLNKLVDCILNDGKQRLGGEETLGTKYGSNLDRYKNLEPICLVAHVPGVIKTSLRFIPNSQCWAEGIFQRSQSWFANRGACTLGTGTCELGTIARLIGSHTCETIKVDNRGHHHGRTFI